MFSYVELEAANSREDRKSGQLSAEFNVGNAEFGARRGPLIGQLSDENVSSQGQELGKALGLPKSCS